MILKRCFKTTVLLSVCLLVHSTLSAQIAGEPLKSAKRFYRIAKTEGNRINVKVNSLLLVGIVNPAVEFKVMKHFTLQTEAFGAFYTTDFLGTGKPFVLGAGFLEFRYYPRVAFSGFYLAPNVGYGVYKLNKGLVLRYTDTYKNDSFQVGSNVMAGITIGYQWNIDNHWSLEVTWGGGFQHSVYQGFSRKSKDEPYVMYVDRNASAEWPPLYKGGLFLGYRF
ncbi:MAG: DUF3575 domain-containing protein [Bacteroidales bacterium]|nr:DUF3575 domain-containing protein [Bacteroidales bacterium]